MIPDSSIAMFSTSVAELHGNESQVEADADGEGEGRAEARGSVPMGASVIVVISVLMHVIAIEGLVRAHHGGRT